MKFLSALLVLVAISTLRAGDDSHREPDTVILKDGTKLRGLIVKNTASEVILQHEFHEHIIPKSDILRIDDHPDILYTDVPRRGDLPSWRVIANDLRTHDNIKSVLEIPATMIDTGVFQRVPYKSFRVNRDIELNIYGDPNDPAGIELGIYGTNSGNTKLRRMLRGYLAGFLSTRKEVAALYSLDLNGGIARAGNLTLEITPKDAPDAYGAWWISLYHEKALDEARLSEAEYARLTKPLEEVIDPKGRVRARWTPQEVAMSERVEDDDAPVLLRGFYRDRKGEFRVIEDPAPAN
jgi:hypothetical protein